MGRGRGLRGSTTVAPRAGKIGAGKTGGDQKKVGNVAKTMKRTTNKSGIKNTVKNRDVSRDGVDSELLGIPNFTRTPYGKAWLRSPSNRAWLTKNFVKRSWTQRQYVRTRERFNADGSLKSWKGEWVNTKFSRWVPKVQTPKGVKTTGVGYSRASSGRRTDISKQGTGSKQTSAQRSANRAVGQRVRKSARQRDLRSERKTPGYTARRRLLARSKAARGNQSSTKSKGYTRSNVKSKELTRSSKLNRTKVSSPKKPSSRSVRSKGRRIGSSPNKQVAGRVKRVNTPKPNRDNVPSEFNTRSMRNFLRENTVTQNPQTRGYSISPRPPRTTQSATPTRVRSGSTGVTRGMGRRGTQSRPTSRALTGNELRESVLGNRLPNPDGSWSRYGGTAGRRREAARQRRGRLRAAERNRGNNASNIRSRAARSRDLQRPVEDVVTGIRSDGTVIRRPTRVEGQYLTPTQRQGGWYLPRWIFPRRQGSGLNIMRIDKRKKRS